jgi:hypothetical protein
VRLPAHQTCFENPIQDSSGETLAEFDASITKLNAEIERMTPNMKAMDRHVALPSRCPDVQGLMTCFSLRPQTR